MPNICNIQCTNIVSNICNNIHDMEVQYKHVSGASNQVADTLSRWQGSPAQVEFLYSQVSNPQWLNVTVDLLELDPYL